MFNLNKKAARKIIGSTMIFGSIAAATLRGNYYANLLEAEKRAHESTAQFTSADIHDLRVENEYLHKRAIDAEAELYILKHDLENL